MDGVPGIYFGDYLNQIVFGIWKNQIPNTYKLNKNYDTDISL